MRVAACLLAALLAACGSSSADLTYAPTRPIRRSGIGGGIIAPVVDARPIADATRIGLIAGSDAGEPQVLRTEAPVSEVVRAAMTDALRARNLLAPQPTGAPQVAVIVKQLDIARRAHLDALVEIGVIVRRPGGRDMLFSRTIRVQERQLDVPVASTSAVAAASRRTLASLLSEVVDQLLDDPGLLAALRPPTGAGALRG